MLQVSLNIGWANYFDGYNEMNTYDLKNCYGLNKVRFLNKYLISLLDESGLNWKKNTPKNFCLLVFSLSTKYPLTLIFENECIILQVSTGHLEARERSCDNAQANHGSLRLYVSWIHWIHVWDLGEIHALYNTSYCILRIYNFRFGYWAVHWKWYASRIVSLWFTFALSFLNIIWTHIKMNAVWITFSRL